jgi:integrase
VEDGVIVRSNYLLVQEHLKYLGEVMQTALISVERYRFHLRHLLIWADERSWLTALEIRPTFPVYLKSLSGENGSRSLAAVTQEKVLKVSQRFFRWLRETHPREFGKLSPTWIDTLRLAPGTPAGIREHEYVSEEEIKQLAQVPIPPGDLALLRDRAASVMLFLSGTRAGAFTSLPIQVVDIPGRAIRQWPELGVRTKFGKRATTYLLEIPELLDVVANWDMLVREKLPGTAAWYAPIESCWGEQEFSGQAPGRNRGEALYKRLKILFSRAGLPFMGPHRFRHGHAVFGLLHAKDMADYKAVSSNLMHADITITDEIYAPLLAKEVKERIAGLGKNPTGGPNTQLEFLLQSSQKSELKAALLLCAELLSK